MCWWLYAILIQASARKRDCISGCKHIPRPDVSHLLVSTTSCIYTGRPLPVAAIGLSEQMADAVWQALILIVEYFGLFMHYFYDAIWCDINCCTNILLVLVQTFGCKSHHSACPRNVQGYGPGISNSIVSDSCREQGGFVTVCLCACAIMYVVQSALTVSRSVTRSGTTHAWPIPCSISLCPFQTSKSRYAFLSWPYTGKIH